MSAEPIAPGLTACVLHTGYIDRKGYGVATVRKLGAHRVAWEAVHGPVPPGLHLHHICETRACVNVDHLAAITPEAHGLLHAALHFRTHCVNGHPFDAENTYVQPGRSARLCRACNRVRVARYKKEKAS